MLGLLFLLAVQGHAAPDSSAAAAVTRWSECLGDVVERAPPGEPAEATADRALESCEGEEQAVAAERIARYGRAGSEEAQARMRAAARTLALRRASRRLAAAHDPLAAANHAFAACLGQQVGHDALGTSRAPERIVDDAAIACRPQRERMRAVLADRHGAAAADRIVEDLLAQMRRQGIELIGESRRARGR